MTVVVRLLQAFADRLAEAMAERMQEHIRTEWWGYAAGETLPNAEFIAKRYIGIFNPNPSAGEPIGIDQFIVVRAAFEDAFQDRGPQAESRLFQHLLRGRVLAA